MAQKGNTYDAFIGLDESGQYKPVAVDLFNLPYDEFDSLHPLEIWGDVDMGRQKKGVKWPDLSNVIIENDFNCSGFKIESDTVLPRSMAGLICLHSINDLGVLIGKLNPDVEAVVVRRAILNDVKNGREPGLSNALEFVRVYPNINVVDEDEKINLKDILQERENAKSAAKSLDVPLKSSKKLPSQALPSKTDEWLTIEEMADLCTSKSDVVAACSADIVLRYVKKARSCWESASINVQDCVRHDGAKIKCIHRDSCDAVLGKVVQLIQEDNARQERKESKKSTKATEKKQAKQELYPKKQGKVDLPKVTKIKKYIPKNIWKDICSAAGKNKVVLLSVLQEIERINVMPTDTQGRKVVYVEDGVAKVSMLVDFKNSYRLTQSMGVLFDKPRIVWSVCDDEFVAIDFFADHLGNDCEKYHAAIRDKTQYLSINFATCFSVTDLIKEAAGSGNGGADFDTGNDGEFVDKTENKNYSHDGHVQNSVTNVSEPDVLYSVRHEWAEKYQCVQDTQRKILAEIISNPDNTDGMIKSTRKLHQLLLYKKSIEELMRRFDSLSFAIDKATKAEKNPIK
ncbi:MAG: hypothetical protein J6K82_01145 [Alphaproteobacteria bacterium]|nr:hypothetical protein [Alphaproteobacteria bacterium]